MDEILDSPANSARTIQYAGFWIRVVAYFIDGIVLSVVIGIFVVLFIGSLFTGGGGAQSLGFIGLFYLLAISSQFIYFAAMESSPRQATLGKMALGIKVGDKDGNAISFMNALGRNLGKILSGLILYFGFIMVGWDSKNQGLHDKLADTYVYYG